VTTGFPDFLVPLVSLGGMSAVIALVGLFIRFRGRGLVVEQAIVERGAGPLGIMVVRWGGAAMRQYSAGAVYVGRWRGAGERVTIRYKAGHPEQIEIVGPNTRGVYLFWIAGIGFAIAAAGSLALFLTS
jgi:hypothetical protein